MVERFGESVESRDDVDVGVSTEVVAKRCTEAIGSVMGLPIPTTSIFVRSRKRVRMRKTPGGLVPLYKFDEKTTVCVAANDAEGALRAAEGGARRIELAPCTTGELRAAITALSRCPQPTSLLFAHLAHERQWILTEWEKVALRVDVQLVKSSGAAGVVLAAFRQTDENLDVDFLEKIVKLARPIKVYLTRNAFETFVRGKDDATLDASIEMLRALGIAGVYAAFRNLKKIDREKQFARLLEINKGRLCVVAQPGLTLHNARHFVAATKVSHVLFDDLDDEDSPVGYLKAAVSPPRSTLTFAQPPPFVPRKKEPAAPAASPGDDVYAKCFSLQMNRRRL